MADISVVNLAPKAAVALSATDQVVTFTQDGDTNRMEFQEAVGQAQANNGCVCLKTVKLYITSAEVLALNTTPKQFGITVPAGYYISGVNCDFKSTYGGSAYATNTTLGIRAVGASSTVFVKQINYTGDVFSKSTDSATGVQYIEGVDFEAYVETGNPTAGNSDITLYLTYILVEL